jgi:ComF family protein
VIAPADVGDWFGHFLFPPVCAGCGRAALAKRSLCQTCWNRSLEQASRPEIPPGLEAVVCGPLLDEATRSLVHGLKYQGFRRAARDLVDLARSSVPSDFCLPGSVLVPVPIHPHRRRERGYNQSAELAKHWSRHLGVPVAEEVLRRVVDTATQTRLDAEKRRSNLENAFQAGKALSPECPVVLIDDVLTTGATLSACAAALLLGGAPSVRAICVVWAGEA